MVWDIKFEIRKIIYNINNKNLTKMNSKIALSSASQNDLLNINFLNQLNISLLSIMKKTI